MKWCLVIWKWKQQETADCSFLVGTAKCDNCGADEAARKSKLYRRKKDNPPPPPPKTKKVGFLFLVLTSRAFFSINPQSISVRYDLLSLLLRRRRGRCCFVMLRARPSLVFLLKMIVLIRTLHPGITSFLCVPAWDSCIENFQNYCGKYKKLLFEE